MSGIKQGSHVCTENPLSRRRSTPCEGVESDALVTNMIAHDSEDDSWVDESEMSESEMFRGKACSTALAVVGTEEDEVSICALHSSCECVRDLCREHHFVASPTAMERLLLDIFWQHAPFVYLSDKPHH